jgi:hypothetical protein
VGLEFEDGPIVIVWSVDVSKDAGIIDGNFELGNAMRVIF